MTVHMGRLSLTRKGLLERNEMVLSKCLQVQNSLPSDKYKSLRAFAKLLLMEVRRVSK